MPNDTAPNPAARPDDGTELTRSLHRSAGSYELAFAPVLMALIGLWIDRTAGTVPVFTILLAVLGALGAGVKLYYQYDRSMQRLAEEGTLAPARPASQYHARRRTDAVEERLAVQAADESGPTGEVAP